MLNRLYFLIRLIWLLPLFVVLQALEPLFRWRKKPQISLRAVEVTTHRPGISVVIPECANPELLGECLESVGRAAVILKEPVQVVIVVNGSSPYLYDHLRRRFPEAEWLFFDKPMGYSRAITQGIKRARHGWVYLLNNDVVMALDALIQVAQLRAAHVFAIASQIFFKDPNRRREETGWTDFSWENGELVIFDALPEGQKTIRGTLYAGGGASLFQKALLERLLDSTHPYHPFYWEDVEWGVKAWKKGYASVFCPSSKVWHSHRATVNKFYPEYEVKRIFRRHQLQFRLRNRMPGDSNWRIVKAIARMDWKSFGKLALPSNMLRCVKSRFQALPFPCSGASLRYARLKYYRRVSPSARKKPLIVLVSPYCIFPPFHGGAVRVYSLMRALSASYEFVVLSDEGTSYGMRAVQALLGYAAEIHLVAGRDLEVLAKQEIVKRVRHHSTDALREELRRLAISRHPQAVIIEFMELAALVEEVPQAIPKVLSLHEVLLGTGSEEKDSVQSAWIRQYDATVVVSEEDQALMAKGSNGERSLRGFSEAPPTWLVPNAVHLNSRYVPSQAARILFVGPFRYPPNLNGIVLFLKCVYPLLLPLIENLELWVVGGSGALERAQNMEAFGQPGVRLFEYVPDIHRMLQESTVTINPADGIRGSSLKVIESIASGRVCISTREGARGFLDSGFPSLVIRETIEEFASPLQNLLCDATSRHALEFPRRELLEEFTWTRSGQKLRTELDRLIGRL